MVAGLLATRRSLLNPSPSPRTTAGTSSRPDVDRCSGSSSSAPGGSASGSHVGEYSQGSAPVGSHSNCNQLKRKLAGIKAGSPPGVHSSPPGAQGGQAQPRETADGGAEGSDTSGPSAGGTGMEVDPGARQLVAFLESVWDTEGNRATAAVTAATAAAGAADAATSMQSGGLAHQAHAASDAAEGMDIDDIPASSGSGGPSPVALQVAFAAAPAAPLWARGAMGVGEEARQATFSAAPMSPRAKGPRLLLDLNADTRMGPNAGATLDLNEAADGNMDSDDSMMAQDAGGNQPHAMSAPFSHPRHSAQSSSHQSSHHPSSSPVAQFSAPTRPPLLVAGCGTGSSVAGPQATGAGKSSTPLLRLPAAVPVPGRLSRSAQLPVANAAAVPGNSGTLLSASGSVLGQPPPALREPRQDVSAALNLPQASELAGTQGPQAPPGSGHLPTPAAAGAAGARPAAAMGVWSSMGAHGLRGGDIVPAGTQSRPAGQSSPIPAAASSPSGAVQFQAVQFQAVGLPPSPSPALGSSAATGLSALPQIFAPPGVQGTGSRSLPNLGGRSPQAAAGASSLLRMPRPLLPKPLVVSPGDPGVQGVQPLVFPGAPGSGGLQNSPASTIARGSSSLPQSPLPGSARMGGLGGGGFAVGGSSASLTSLGRAADSAVAGGFASSQHHPSVGTEPQLQRSISETHCPKRQSLSHHSDFGTASPRTPPTGGVPSSRLSSQMAQEMRTFETIPEGSEPKAVSASEGKKIPRGFVLSGVFDQAYVMQRLKAQTEAAATEGAAGVTLSAGAVVTTSAGGAIRGMLAAGVAAVPGPAAVEALAQAAAAAAGHQPSAFARNPQEVRPSKFAAIHSLGVTAREGLKDKTCVDTMYRQKHLLRLVFLLQEGMLTTISTHWEASCRPLGMSMGPVFCCHS